MERELPDCLITAASIQGSRPDYEDRIDIRGRLVSNHPFIYCAVYDGHGGGEAADMAQKLMLHYLKKDEDFLSKDETLMIQSLKRGFLLMDKKMKESSSNWSKEDKKDIWPSAGTTASIVVIYGNLAFIANVGDSPVYLITKADVNSYEIELGCTLHTPEFKPDYQRVRAFGGEIAEDSSHSLCVKPIIQENNSARILRMTRALGDFWIKNPNNYGKIVNPEPDVRVVNLEKENIAFIIIASDGLFMNSESIATCVLRSIGHNMNPAQYLISKMCSSIPDTRFDNTSVICMEFPEVTRGKLTNFKLSELDCGRKSSIDDDKVYSFNELFCHDPNAGIIFTNGKVMYAETKKIIIPKSETMVPDEKHHKPGYVIPV
uniref:PPM-type phosphatase domain-containing protein n=1 Tax=Panagrolaimus sp. JU765 TaxID=591449 RepID=A0AC34QAM6_9BILA